MQLKNDAYNSCDERDSGDNDTILETSSSTSSLTAIPVEKTMSSKRQLQFIKMWGESRKMLYTQPKPQQKQEPSVKNKNHQKQLPSQTRTFIPSSAWRGLVPENLENESIISSPQSPKAPLKTVVSSSKVVAADEAHNQIVFDIDKQSEEYEKDFSNKQTGAMSNTFSMKEISEESAVSVLSLCEAAAAAAATDSQTHSTSKEQRTAPTLLRQPAQIAALLDNIRLGRRHMYTKDSFAMKLERDLRAELNSELDKQHRFDARLDSLSFGSEEKVTQHVVGNIDDYDKVCINSSENVAAERSYKNTNDSVSANLGVVSRIRRAYNALGSRYIAEASIAMQRQLNNIKQSSNRAQLVSQKAVKKIPETAAYSRSGLYKRNSRSTSSTNSSSEGSDSDFKRQLCRWRRPRASSSNTSNINRSNYERPEDFLDEKFGIEKSNNGVPSKRQVFERSQGQGSQSKWSPGEEGKLVGGHRTMLNESGFEANPNHAVKPDHVHQSVEQLEPFGAVRILDSGLPTDQLTSTTALSDESSNAVAFTPKPTRPENAAESSQALSQKNMTAQQLQSSDRFKLQQSPGQLQPKAPSLNNSGLRENCEQENEKSNQQSAPICETASKQPGKINWDSDLSLSLLQKEQEEQVTVMVFLKPSLADKNQPSDDSKPKASPDAYNDISKELDELRHEIGLDSENTAVGCQKFTSGHHGHELPSTQPVPSVWTNQQVQQHQQQTDLDSLQRWLYSDNKQDHNRSNQLGTLRPQSDAQATVIADQQQHLLDQSVSCLSGLNDSGSDAGSVVVSHCGEAQPSALTKSVTDPAQAIISQLADTFQGKQLNQLPEISCYLGKEARQSQSARSNRWFQSSVNLSQQINQLRDVSPLPLIIQDQMNEVEQNATPFSNGATVALISSIPDAGVADVNRRPKLKCCHIVCYLPRIIVNKNEVSVALHR